MGIWLTNIVSAKTRFARVASLNLKQKKTRKCGPNASQIFQGLDLAHVLDNCATKSRTGNFGSIICQPREVIGHGFRLDSTVHAVDN